MGDFDWDEEQQGLVLGGFSIGYVLTQFLGGYLSERYGGKWVFGACTLGSSVVGAFVPLAATIHPTILVLVRALQGAFQGPTFPCSYAMAAKWLPAQEKARLMAFILSGMLENSPPSCTRKQKSLCASVGPCTGIVLGTPLTGILVKQTGWESVFYIEGGIGVAWFLLFAVLLKTSRNDPARLSIANLT